MLDVQVSKRHAFAEGTYSNLHTQFRTYFAFCVYFQRRPLPASSDTICGYVQFLSRALQPPTIKNYLSGVRTLHTFLGHDYDFSEDFHLQLVLRGISRLNPHVPRRAKPVTPDVLLAIYHHLNFHNSLHCTVWACCLTLFFTMARLGSILPASTKVQNTQGFLTKARVNFSREGILITLLKTKTMQFGRRRLHIPLIALDSPLCPVRAYTKSISFIRHCNYSPAFAFISRGKVEWLTKKTFIATFRDVAAAAGFADASQFTGHSFRRGGASWAFQAGVPGELIQICGDWASDAYKQYLEFSMSNKICLAGLFCRGLPQC